MSELASGRRRAANALLAAAYAAALAWPFRPFAERFSTHLIGDHGDALLLHLHCAWQWSAIAEGRFAELLALPTMHPYSSGFAFGETLLGITLPLVPVYALTGSSAATFNLAVALSFALLFAAVAGWVRELFDSPAAGLAAAMAVVFVPWRVHYHSAVNVLTVHYALFGMWLLWRWTRAPRWAPLLGAAALFYAQVVTAAQVAVAAVYLTGIWMVVLWVARGCRLVPRRALQVAVASALFAALCAPWLGFYAEAFDATPGLLRTGEMARYSVPFAEMARSFGATGALGAMAAAGGVALAAAGRRRGVGPGRDAVVNLIAIGCAAGLLFVVGRGPYVGGELDPTPLPGYWAARFAPLIDTLRAPIRLAGLTPIALALWAGAGWAIAERWLGARGARWQLALRALPLLIATRWLPLPAAMGAPLAERPDDLALAEALARLPDDAVILPLPLDPEPSGAAVDEWVGVHRRAQIGGFASIVPEPFRRAMVRLGQWPREGGAVARALGATHAVVPALWLDRLDGTDVPGGATRVGGRAIVELADRAAPVARAWRVDAPEVAAAGRWLTLAIAPDAAHYDPRGHASAAAHWSGPATRSASAYAFLPGVADADQPVRVWVPTPRAPGRYALRVDWPGVDVAAEVEIRDLPTTRDAAVRDVAIAPLAVPAYAVRAGEAFPVDVALRAGAGAPLLLATSRCPLPERCGEVAVAYEYRMLAPRPGLAASGELPARAALTRDLAPGETQRRRWDLRAPPLAGSWSLRARLRARGRAAAGDWSALGRIVVQ